MKGLLLRATLVGLLLAGLNGCSGGDGAAVERTAATGPEAGAAAEGPRPARTLPLPGTVQPDRSASGASRGLRWDLPDGWLKEPPTSSMRFAQYRVPGPAGDGECVVFYFGPGQGGDPMANAMRWARQFEQPDGSSSLDVMQLSTLEGASLDVQLVEVTGIYDGGMTMTDMPPDKQPGYMLLGAIVQGPDAPWFFKFTGPEATVRAQREAFLGMLGAIQAGS